MKKAFFLLIAASVFSLTSASALFQSFDTTGHVKAHGALVTVSYPTGWTSQEGLGPKIVHNFYGDYAGVTTVLSLAIEAQDEHLEGVCAKASKEDWIKGSAGLNWPITTARVFSRSGKPAAMIETMQASKYDGSVFHAQAQTMVVCHKRYMIKLTCATTSTPELTKSGMQKIAPLCKQYFDSLTLKG